MIFQLDKILFKDYAGGFGQGVGVGNFASTSQVSSLDNRFGGDGGAFTSTSVGSSAGGFPGGVGFPSMKFNIHIENSLINEFLTDFGFPQAGFIQPFPAVGGTVLGNRFSDDGVSSVAGGSVSSVSSGTGGNGVFQSTSSVSGPDGKVHTTHQSGRI